MRTRRFILKILLFSIFCACKTKSGPEESPHLNNESGLALLSANDITVRPMVDAIRLDETDFRINALRVGLETFIGLSTPIISYKMPKLADYVDILRCDAKVIIYGGNRFLNNVELDTESAENEAQEFRQNNFWEDAINNANCEQIMTGYTDTTYEDATATPGEYRYLLRACVDPVRLQGTSTYSKANCSRNIVETLPVKCTNSRVESERSALIKAANLRSQLDTAGRNIAHKTELLQQELLACQERTKQRVTSAEQKNAFSVINKATLIGIPALGALTVGLHFSRISATPTKNTESLNKISSLRDISLAALGFTGFAAVVTNSLKNIVNPAVPDYPKDDPSCYKSQTPSKPVPENICSCADALGIQNDLDTIGVSYLQTLKLYNYTMGNSNPEENVKTTQ